MIIEIIIKCQIINYVSFIQSFDQSNIKKITCDIRLTN